MAEFKDVFSTTAKVILALVIISALIGVGFLIVGGLGSVVVPASSTGAATTDKYEDTADARRTTMPKSVWDRGITKAVRSHCVTDGMNEEEVLRALGNPTSKSGRSWTWQLPAGECLKYDGDQCIEQKENHAIIFLTAKGNVYLHSVGCEDINNSYVFLDSELFGK